MHPFSTFLVYLLATTLLVVNLTDAKRRSRPGIPAMFDENGYAVSSRSCPVGYVTQCVPDPLSIGWVGGGINGLGGGNGFDGGIYGISGGNGAGGIMGGNGVGGGSIVAGSVGPDIGIEYKPCPPCPPSFVCSPSTGRCIFVWG